MKYQYTIIRSNRKTIGIELKPEGVLVRAPFRATNHQIEKFVESHEDWIDKHMVKLQAKIEHLSHIVPLSDEEITVLMDAAKKYIPERVKYYAPLVGTDYNRVAIHKQKTRWGSCSAKGNLNFNCLLMLTPPEVIDSVVVHELCHRKYMNHSKAFYDEVISVFPEYMIWHKWLNDHGPELLANFRDA